MNLLELEKLLCFLNILEDYFGDDIEIVAVMIIYWRLTPSKDLILPKDIQTESFLKKHSDLFKFQANENEYVIKPIDWENLVQTIQLKSLVL